MRWILGLAGLLLAACSVGLNYSRPGMDVPAAFRGQEGEANERSLADLAWWDVYRDPVLQGLLRTALEQNRDVQIAAARIAEARAQVGASRLAEFPQVNIGASGARGRTFQFGQNVTGSLFSLQAQASFEVDFWRRLASLTEAARAALLASEFGRESVRIGLVSDVSTVYFNLLSLDQQFRITERTVVSRERFLQLTQTRFRLGAASALDVNRAEASLAAARANLPDLQRQIAQTENQLQILLGRNPASVERQSIDLETVPQPPEVPVGLPSSLLERRPDVLQAEASLVAATADIRAARAALFPTISLTAAYGGESLELTNLFSGPARVWSFGLNLIQPLINAQRNGYVVEAAQARRQEAILQYQGTVAQAFREVSDALAARRGFTDFLLAQQRQVAALREAQARVLRRYETGYSSYFEVIDAETNLYAAELQLSQAYRNNLLALVQLYRALGGGWQTGSANASEPRLQGAGG